MNFKANSCIFCGPTLTCCWTLACHRFMKPGSGSVAHCHIIIRPGVYPMEGSSDRGIARRFRRSRNNFILPLVWPGGENKIEQGRLRHRVKKQLKSGKIG